MSQTVASRARRSSLGDMIFEGLATGAGVLVLVLLGAIILSLFIGGLPAFQAFGVGFLTSDDWDPVKEIFGAVVPIYGTIVTSVMALIMAVPVAFGIAFWLTELAPAWLRRPVGTAVELLAAVPSIIYGMWGFFVIVPIMAEYIQPAVIGTIGQVPGVGPLFRGPRADYFQTPSESRQRPTPVVQWHWPRSNVDRERFHGR